MGDNGDWAKYNLKIPLSFTYEMRDTGEYGFILPAKQIIPNCLEIMYSLITIFKESENHGYFELDKTTTSFIDF